MKLVTSAEMRELEAAAVAAGTSEAQLMEEAGLAVAQEAWMLLGSLEGRRIVVLAGPGNNGGDSLVAGRHLCDWGAEVIVYAPRGRGEDDNRAELEQREVRIVDGSTADGEAELEPLLGTADLVVDALLGIGQKRPLAPDEPIATTLQKLAAARKGFNPPKQIGRAHV